MAKFQMPEAAKAKITKVRRIRTKLNSEEEESLLSKSSMKRDAEEVHRLAEALVEMKATEYKKLELEDDLRTHLDLARRIDAHIARKRQILFVAKQLRKRPDALSGLFAAVDKPKSEQKRETARMHRIEHLRDELVAEGDEALSKLLTQHPQADRQQLRTLVRQAAMYKARQQQALDDGKPAPHNDGSYSALYKALNALLSQAEKNEADADGKVDSEADDDASTT